MVKLSEEAAAYNAIATDLRGNYERLKKIKGHFRSWKNALAEKKFETALRNKESASNELEKRGIRLILDNDPSYPRLLKEIFSPPFGLYVIGILPKETDKNVAIVGTRKATVEGKNHAILFAKELALSRCNIMSGLALGIDAGAHEGALKGGGYTLAVLAHGLHTFYPKHNEGLAKKILESGGAIISEYPLNTPSLPHQFLERNRIVSGLSHGVVIIEAPLRSGSLATARYAMEQNREVFVIPGPARHPNFEGSHELIREGAELVTSPHHVLESLGVSKTNALVQGIAGSNDYEKQIFEALKNSTKPLSVDKIIEISNLNVQVVNKTLTTLLIKNAIKETEQGYSL